MNRRKTAVALGRNGPRKFFGWLVPLLSLAAGSALGSEYAQEWGPEVGTELPVLEAFDQAGRLRTLDDLAGEVGLLLFMSRSADW